MKGNPYKCNPGKKVCALCQQRVHDNRAQENSHHVGSREGRSQARSSLIVVKQPPSFTSRERCTEETGSGEESRRADPARALLPAGPASRQEQNLTAVNFSKDNPQHSHQWMT